MRVIVLTSSLQGMAALAVPRLAQEPGIEIAMVVYSEGQVDRWRELKRKLRKTLRIGPLGALAGMRMRDWFRQPAAPPLDETARALGLRFERVPKVNCERTRELFREASADLGLSLGNSYIGKKVFSIPRLGMLNVHHELLPEYQGAQSIIWQVHDGKRETGYTIHEIDEHIDTGRILYREALPIEFRETLEATVRHNLPRLRAASVEGLVRVLRDFERYRSQAAAQRGGRTFTTPTYAQFRRMEREHARLRRQQS